MYKLLLLDIDGTLRDEMLGIPDSTHRAIRLCQKNHCHVVICTGRSIGTIPDDVFSVHADGYITGGGNYIEYQNLKLFNSAFPQKNIHTMIEYLKNSSAGFTIESQEKVFMNQKAKIILDSMNESKKARKTQNHFTIPNVYEKIQYEDNLYLYKNQPIHKICLWSTPEIFQKIPSCFTEKMKVVQYNRYKNLYYYEIIQKGCDKGMAVKRLQRHLQIDQTETICFGDGDNDMDMFRASHIGIAMRNSSPALKKIADSICEDVFENGIYNELERRNVI